MCVPSMAPTHWGNPHLLLHREDDHQMVHWYNCVCMSTIASQTSLTETKTEESPQYSAFEDVVSGQSIGRWRSHDLLKHPTTDCSFEKRRIPFLHPYPSKQKHAPLKVPRYHKDGVWHPDPPTSLPPQTINLTFSLNGRTQTVNLQHSSLSKSSLTQHACYISQQKYDSHLVRHLHD